MGIARGGDLFFDDLDQLACDGLRRGERVIFLELMMGLVVHALLDEIPGWRINVDLLTEPHVPAIR